VAMAAEPGVAARRVRTIGRVLLGLFLAGAGIGHLTIAREGFQAQVPRWLPFDKDFVVLASGVVEILLGLAVLLVPTRIGHWPTRVLLGWIVAAFFVAIFPGNISQLVTSVQTAGWDDSILLVVRLFFQPLLVAWALWSTGAWRAWRDWVRARRAG
jgi:uncharacterized membrane protein